jgi:hypothetical protein
VAAFIVASAAVGGLFLMRLYAYLWHAYWYQSEKFYMPYPDVIGPALHKYIGPQYDAAEVEISLEFFVILLIVFTGVRWIGRRILD